MRKILWALGVTVAIVAVLLAVGFGRHRPSALGVRSPLVPPPAPAMCVGAVCSGQPAFLTPASAGGANFITLVYVQPGVSYADPTAYRPLVAHLSPTGAVEGPFLDSFLFLALPAPSGGTYANPSAQQTASDASDWQAFLQAVFQRALPALQTAYTQVRPPLTLSWPRRLDVFLMVPYPSTTMTVFGNVEGTPLDFASEVDRETALRWYVRQVVADWRQANFPDLRLVGLYWMREDVLPYQQAEITSLAQAIHPYGLRLLWIPWKGAEYAGDWAHYGFDAAVFQPNYYQNGETSVSGGRPTDLTWTAQFARQYHMGIELELDQGITGSLVKAQRFYQYLADGQQLGYEHNTLIAIYQGGGGIARLATSPGFYWLYNDLYLFTRGRPIPPAPPGALPPAG